MRTVDPILTAALATGKGRPYIKGTIGYTNGAVKHTDDVLDYELTGTTLKFHVENVSDFASDQTAMWLERGLIINGTTYSVTTGRFRIVHQTYLADGSQIAEGHLFPPSYYSANGYDTYENVITAFCTAFGKTAVFADAGAAWRNYKFLGLGQNILLTDASKMLNLLAQKRLISLCDNGSEQVLVYCADVMPAIDFTLTPAHDWEIAGTKLRYRQYIWRDEAGTYHQSGTATYPIHNLGYLESTASAPARTSWAYETDYLVPPNFEYQDGDVIKFMLYGGAKTFTFFSRIVEKYDPRSKSEPASRVHIQANPIFENTEGGWYPPGMLNQLNYLPLNTSAFKKNLTANENNLQVAMEKLDAATRERLFANRTYYVRTDGSDSNTGLVNSAAGAFLTIQHAYDVAVTLDCAGYTVTIQIADGTYAHGAIMSYPLVGGNLVINGNSGTPANVLLSTSDWYGAFFIITPIIVKFSNFKIATSAGSAIYVDKKTAAIEIGVGMNFGACASNHIYCQAGSVTVTANYTISGSTGSHFFCTDQGQITGGSNTVTLTGTPAFSGAFAFCQVLSGISIYSATYSGAATGKRYDSSKNAAINTYGGGANYFPGNVAGTTATGGIYV